MNPEEQRIAIAEACGTMKWSYALPKKCVHCDVPDYLNDLNECHEMEKVLESHSLKYIELLKEIVGRELWATTHEWNLCHATAAQRCEAFLRTLGLWKEAAQHQDAHAAPVGKVAASPSEGAKDTP